MKFEEFKVQVTENFYKVFPNGHIRFSSLCLSGGFYLRFGLISDINDQVSKIRENDPFSLSFICHNDVNGDVMTEKIELEVTEKCIWCQPFSHLYAMRREKINARKQTQTPEKIIKYIDKVVKDAAVKFEELAAQNQIYGQKQIPEKYLIINQ